MRLVLGGCRPSEEEPLRWEGRVNVFLARLKRLVAPAPRPVSISQAAFSRYLECVEEWNASCLDPDWAYSDRARECHAFMQWFEELHE